MCAKDAERGVISLTEQTRKTGGVISLAWAKKAGLRAVLRYFYMAWRQTWLEVSELGGVISLMRQRQRGVISLRKIEISGNISCRIFTSKNFQPRICRPRHPAEHSPCRRPAPTPVSYTHLDVYKRQLHHWCGVTARLTNCPWLNSSPNAHPRLLRAPWPRLSKSNPRATSMRLPMLGRSIFPGVSEKAWSSLTSSARRKKL